MTFWELIGVGALVVGMAMIAVKKFVARSRHAVDGRSEQNGFLSSVAFGLALIVLEPSLIARSVASCAKMLWNGGIPFTDYIWSPARAARLDFENWGFSSVSRIPSESGPRCGTVRNGFAAPLPAELVTRRDN